MTLDKRYENDRLSDNTHKDYCLQCKNCVKWGGNDPFMNKYDKSNCKAFPFPGFKPNDVMEDKVACPYKETI